MILYATLKQKNASNLRLPPTASDASWGALTIRRWGRWWCKWPCCPWAPGNVVHGNFPKNQGLLCLIIKDITMIHLYLKKPFSNRFGWRHALNTEIPHLVEVDILLTIPQKNLRLFFERPRHDLVTKRDPPQNTTPASLLESKKQLYSSIIHHFREYPTVPPSPSVPSVFLPDARKICVHT